MARLRGSAGAGAGSLRQAKTSRTESLAKTSHNYKKRLVSEQEGGGANSETSL